MRLVVVLTLVGNIGAPAATVEVEVDVSMQATPVPQSRPLEQHPPPREAAQDWKPGLQVNVLSLAIVVVVVTVSEVVELVGKGVGATTTIVDWTMVVSWTTVVG